MGRHVAVAGSPFSLPHRRVEFRSPASPGTLSTGSLTRAGIAAALVTASAAAVAGSTGAIPAIGASDISTGATTMLASSTPQAASGPTSAAAVAPVAAVATPAPAHSAVKSTSPAQKAAADQKDAADKAAKAASAKAAAAKKQASQDSSSGSAAGLGSLGDRIVAQAAQFKGIPYVYGGTTPDGFDCSGLTKYVFGKMGISLPRTAQQQYDAAQHISESQAQPGDLVFMGGENSIYHVAIYAGNGKIWTAPETGQSVKLGNMFGDTHFGRIR